MTDTERPAPSKPAVAEQDVVAYLRENPDMVKRHPDLLAALAPQRTFDSSTVVDMQKFVVERLRQQVDDLKVAGDSLVHTTRSNMSVQGRTHTSALSMLEARDFGDLGRVFSEDLPLNLAVDVVTIGFEANEDGGSALASAAGSVCRLLPHGFLDHVLGSGEIAALNANTDGQETVYGEAAGLVRSEALIRLPARDGLPTGLFAAGSREVGFFSPDQGTDLLAFLAEVARYAVARWVTPAS